MSDERTPRQIAADEVFEAAAQEVADAYEMSDTNAGEWLLSEFLVIAFWANMAEPRGTYHWWTAGKGLPMHHIQGLYAMLGELIETTLGQEEP